MVDIKCVVIPEPVEGTRAIFIQSTTNVAYFSGKGPDSYMCGNCNFVLVRNVSMDQLQKKIHTVNGRHSSSDTYNEERKYTNQTINPYGL
jgi:hypothetical protein